MTTVTSTYLGWEQPQHFDGCRRPEWSVDIRTDYDVFRARHGGPGHGCPNEECDHRGDRYTRTSVRMVCFSCTAAVLVSGEADRSSSGSAKTVTWGYGQQPRKLSGLLLWPGEPFLTYGRLSSDEPWDYLITRPGVKRVTEADVVGVVSQAIGKRGATRWSVVAVRSEDGPYGLSPLRFAHAEEYMRSVAAVAKWAAARLAEAQATQGGGE